LLRIEGEGGTGKSHLINAICSIDPKKKVKSIINLVAPTGRAAHQIYAQTIHSFFSIKYQSFQDLKPGIALDKLQKKMKACKVIICDEFSMVGCRLFDCFERRCRQATGKAHLLFGGLSIVLVGDTRQLPPVLDRCLWNKIKTSTTYIRNAQFAFGEFKNVIRLEQNHRQSDKNQEKFRQLLKRLRVCESTKDDWKILEPRIRGNAENESEFKNATYLIYASHNLTKILEIKQNNSNLKIFEIDAEHNHSKAQSFSANSFSSLEAHLTLIKGAKIMIINNLWTKHGITNGSFGTIMFIIYGPDKHPPGLPFSVIIKMDNDYNGPSLAKFKNYIVINPEHSYHL
jgi:ATP-dependent exoDNAse (exonuclease V) alpha subunit